MNPAKLKATPKGNTPAKSQVVCICVFLVLAVLAVFSQTAEFGFVNYDDGQNVYENPVVQKGLSVQAVGWAFTHAQTANWIPLTTLSHMLDCQIFGLHAGGHHLVNVLWHAANAVLLFLVLRQMTGSLWRSAFVAAVFAVHPLRAESVAWVSERKDVLSGFFFLLTIGAYVGYVRKPSCAGYVVVVLLFALGLLAKSMVATLPFVLLLLDYWPLGRWHDRRQLFRLVTEKIPLLALSAGACLATALVPGLMVPHADRLPLLERIGNALVAYVVYLRQMIFPAGLAALYPNAPHGQPSWKVCLALVVLAAISGMVVAFRKNRPYLLMGWLWYLGMLVPVAGVIQISLYAAHADRYTYLPGIGLAVAGVWAVGDWSAGWKYRRGVLGGAMSAVIAAMMICGSIQTSYWRESELLWCHTLSYTSDNWVADKSLGDALRLKGDSVGAIAEYRKALEINPAYGDAHYNLGVALFDEGAVDEAIAQYRAAVAINPDAAEAHSNLGAALFKKQDPEEAIAEFRKAVQISPDNVDFHYNLGFALLKNGNTDEAIVQLQDALKIKPDYAEARNSLGNAFFLKGNLDAAATEFKKALEIEPDFEDANANLGHSLFLRGDFDDAIATYRRLIKLNARNAGIYGDLGMALLRKGETKEALGCWQHALEINPNQADVLNNLAWCLATTPDASLRNGTKALALATQANQLSGGGNPTMLGTLAAAYAEEGSYGMASVTARSALELAVKQKDDALTATLREEIKLYETGSPVRDATR